MIADITTQREANDHTTTISDKGDTTTIEIGNDGTTTGLDNRDTSGRYCEY